MLLSTGSLGCLLLGGCFLGVIKAQGGVNCPPERVVPPFLIDGSFCVQGVGHIGSTAKGARRLLGV